MHETKSQLAIDCFIAVTKDIESLSGVDLSLDRSYFVKRWNAEGPRCCLELLQKHRDILLHYLRFNKLPSPLGVRSCSSGSHTVPTFMKELWSGLLDTESGKSYRTFCYANLAQVFSLLIKSDLLNVDSDPYLASFRDRMTQVSTWSSLSYGAQDMVDRMGQAFSRDFGDLPEYRDHEWLRLHVSTGAVRDHQPVLDRCESIPSGLPYDFRSLFSPDLHVQHVNRVNRCVAVPKDWRKPRLVFVEESSRMFCQQALRLWLEQRAIACLPDRCRFDDQDYQRSSLMLQGRSSIDLSDATDWLPASVIFRFLRFSPRLRSALFSVRSTRCVTGEGTAEGNTPTVLRCYGTMGNATTFTVVTIFLVYLSRYIEANTEKYCRRLPLRLRPSTVFGDDVVCDDVVAGGILSAMVSVGLKPNFTKTYIGCIFKESCGVESFDESPIPLLRLKSLNVACAEDRYAMLSYSNLAHSLGYWKLAALLNRAIGLVLPVNVDDASLRSFCSGETYVGARYLREEQRYYSKLISKRRVKQAKRDNSLQLEYYYSSGSRLTQVVEDRS